MTETESLLSQGSSGGDGISGSGAGSRASPSSWAVLRKSWKDLLAVFLVFFVTFLMFPGVMVYYEEYKGGFGSNADYLYPWVFGGKWFVIILIALFNVCDTIGRTLPGYSKYIPHIPQKWLLTAILCRALAIPIFVGCAWRWSPSLGDITLTLTTVAFAFSNGYLASSEWVFFSLLCYYYNHLLFHPPLSFQESCSIVYSPRLTQNLTTLAVSIMLGPQNPLLEPHERETLGFLLSLSLNTGIFLGSQCALVFALFQ